MANDKLVVVATTVAKPGREEEVKAALLALIPTTRKEKGFIQYDVHQCHENPRKFVFYEIWEDVESLALHIGTEIMANHKKKVADLIESNDVFTYKRIG